MKIKKLIKENLLLEVFDASSNVYYKSLVQEVNEDSIAVGVPMKDQKQLLLPEDTEWSFRVVVDDALYYFNSKVIGKKFSDHIPLYLINWPEKVERRQRRNFYRLQCLQEVYFWLLYRAGDTDKSLESKFDAALRNNAVKNNVDIDKMIEIMGEPQKAVTSDLSGGGLSFAFPAFFPEGSLIAFALFLRSKKESKDILLKGKVVWTKKLDETGKNARFRHGVEFMGLSEQIREDIVRFVFALSREKLMQ